MVRIDSETALNVRLAGGEVVIDIVTTDEAGEVMEVDPAALMMDKKAADALRHALFRVVTEAPDA